MKEFVEKEKKWSFQRGSFDIGISTDNYNTGDIGWNSDFLFRKSRGFTGYLNFQLYWIELGFHCYFWKDFTPEELCSECNQISWNPKGIWTQTCLNEFHSSDK